MLKEIKSSNISSKEISRFLTPDKKKKQLSINNLCQNTSIKVRKNLIKDSSEISPQSKVTFNSTKN
jgi:hypothetical protein